MARKSVIQITGDKELSNLFKHLDVKPAIIRQISRYAGGIVRKQTRDNIKSRSKSGNLMRGIVVRSGKNRNYASVWVGPNYSKSGPRAPHAHLVAESYKLSTGRISTYKPFGQFVKKAAAQVNAKILKDIKGKYIKVLEKQISKLLK
jgi:hypothetical protein